LGESFFLDQISLVARNTHLSVEKCEIAGSNSTFHTSNIHAATIIIIIIIIFLVHQLPLFYSGWILVVPYSLIYQSWLTLWCENMDIYANM